MASLKPALFWDKHPSGVRCLLCPHHCVIPEDRYGLCRKRKNFQNSLFATNYGETTTIRVDPMEKKPLYHFHPGELVLSLGPNSCNLTCQFCQNYTTSQMDCSVIRVTPEEILQKCLKNNIRHVAFTYAEPFTWYEFIYDTAKLLHKNAISVVLVTNGFVKREPFQLILPYISAMNIDLKSFSDHFYKTFCSGQLTPVLETIKTAVGKCHVEITLLLIETLNDDLWELDHIFKFLHDLSPDIPLHISKYFPRYKMMLPETSLDSLQNHIKRAKTFLKYVYAGNILHSDYLNTYCPQCNDMLIMRSTGSISISNLNNGICANCEEKIPLVVYF